MLKETNHNYQNCLMGNFYDNKCTWVLNSWNEFKNTHAGFIDQNKFDDTYNFVFRYDINKLDNGKYCLELCIMLQRKGIYTHLYINNIDKETLNTEVKEWLKDRYKYMKSLWNEIDSLLID